MAQVQFHNGVVLFRSGQVAMDPACCCDVEPPTPPGPCCPCPACANTPDRLRIIVSGVANNEYCDTCDSSVNGELEPILRKVDHETCADISGIIIDVDGVSTEIDRRCSYTTVQAGTAECPVSWDTIAAFIIEGGQLTFYLFAGNTEYRKVVTDCCDTINLTAADIARVESSLPHLCDWSAAEITIIPELCESCVPCCSCCDEGTSAEYWELSIAGLTDSDPNCESCDDNNAVFILSRDPDDPCHFFGGLTGPSCFGGAEIGLDADLRITCEGSDVTYTFSFPSDNAAGTVVITREADTNCCPDGGLDLTGLLADSKCAWSSASITLTPVGCGSAPCDDFGGV